MYRLSISYQSSKDTPWQAKITHKLTGMRKVVKLPELAMSTTRIQTEQKHVQTYYLVRGIRETFRDLLYRQYGPNKWRQMERHHRKSLDKSMLSAVKRVKRWPPLKKDPALDTPPIKESQ